MLTFLAGLALAVAPDLDKLSAAARGTTGVAIVHVETGHRLALHGADRFPMQSVFKLPIAIEVLAEIDAGKLALDQKVDLVASDRRGGIARGLGEQIPTTVTVRSLLEHMIEESDNTACDKLLALVGGPATVATRMKTLGLPEIVVDRSEQELGDGKPGNLATPEAMARLLEKLVRAELGLSKEGAAMLDDLLAHTVPGEHRLKAGLPPGTALRHKTGTGGSRKGVTEATNDVGVVTLPDGTHLAIVVFVHDARGDEAARERTIAEIARGAYGWAAADR